MNAQPEQQGCFIHIDVPLVSVVHPSSWKEGRENTCRSSLFAAVQGNMVDLIQDLWDQVWQHSTALIYMFLGDRLRRSIDENRQLLVGVTAKDLPMISAIFDDRIRLTLEAWRRAADPAGEAPTC